MPAMTKVVMRKAFEWCLTSTSPTLNDNTAPKQQTARRSARFGSARDELIEQTRITAPFCALLCAEKHREILMRRRATPTTACHISLGPDIHTSLCYPSPSPPSLIPQLLSPPAKFADRSVAIVSLVLCKKTPAITFVTELLSITASSLTMEEQTVTRVLRWLASGGDIQTMHFIIHAPCVVDCDHQLISQSMTQSYSVPGCQSPQQLHPIRTSEIILRTKSPKSCCHVWPTSCNIATERTTDGFRTNVQMRQYYFIVPVGNFLLQQYEHGETSNIR